MNEGTPWILNQTEKYHKLIVDNFKKLEKEKFESTTMPLFVLACSAGLEYFLNSIYIDFCIKLYGDKNYKEYAEGYISLNLKSKLVLVAPTITNNKLVLNQDIGEIKNLRGLITRRNKIVHNKDFMSNVDFKIEKISGEETEIKAKLEDLIKATKNHIDSITEKECREYKDAIDAFCENILFPYNKNEIKENKLLVSISVPNSSQKLHSGAGVG